MVGVLTGAAASGPKLVTRGRKVFGDVSGTAPAVRAGVGRSSGACLEGLPFLGISPNMNQAARSAPATATKIRTITAAPGRINWRCLAGAEGGAFAGGNSGIVGGGEASAMTAGTGGSGCSNSSLTTRCGIVNDAVMDGSAL